MKNKLILIILLICLFSIIDTNNLLAQIDLDPLEKAWLKKNQNISLSSECSYAPIIFEDSTGLPRGLSVDFATEIEKILDVNFTYKCCLNLPELLNDIRNKKIELASSLKSTSERKEYMIFSESYVEIPAIIVSFSKIHKDLKIDNLSKYKIGIASESSLYYEITKLYPDNQIITYDSEFDCLRHLFLKDVDVVLTDAASYSSFIKEYEVKKFKVSNIIPFSYNLAFGAPVGSDTLISIINKAIAEIPNERKEEIYSKWMQFDIQKNSLIKRILNIFYIVSSITVLIIIFIIVWNRQLNKKVILRTIQLNKELKINEEKQNKLTELNTELEIAKNKAEEGDRLKSAFLANLSHEIRTPMNGIIGFANLLKNTTISNENKIKYIDNVTISGNYLISIIEDIIEVSRLETNQVSIHKSVFQINKLVNNIWEEFNISLSGNRNIEFVLDEKTKALDYYINTDKTKLKQILMNLISNSIKYTKSGFIKFGYNLIDDSFIQFYVKDTGIGVKEEQQNLIFDRFRQADTEDQIFQSGSGLGLSISKSYVEILGGKIWIKSEHGKGSTFYFTIPYSPEINIKKETETFKKEINTKNKKTSKSILIAEDDPINYEYLKEVLSDFDFKLFHAWNGKEAIEICKSNQSIELILMDIKMPIMDGIEAFKIIKESHPNIKVIAQTAHAFSKDIENTLKQGFDNYITKPIDKDLLLELILL